MLLNKGIAKHQPRKQLAGNVFSRVNIFSETKGDSLDISWLKDADSVDAADLGTPEELAGEAMTELKGALKNLENLVKALTPTSNSKAGGVKG